MKTIDNRTIMIKSLVGSHNYGLATETSDMDYKVFVAPTFDDLYTQKKHSSVVLTEAEDFAIHDIRKLPELLFKANLNYMEVFASNKMYLCNSKMAEFASYQDEIFKMNLPQFYKSCDGMFKNKMKLLGTATEGTQHLVDKFGFDTKQASHAYRVLKVAVDFAETGFTDFNSAIRYSGEELKFMLAIKNGFFAREVFENFIEHYYESTFLQMKEHYENQPVNIELKDKLENIVKDAVKLDLLN